MNIVTALFGEDRTSTENSARTSPLWQYDYGQVLAFDGIDLPDAYEVHFSNKKHGTSVTQIGDREGVAVPDALLLSGEPVYAWVYLHTGESDGETEYVVTIPVNKRAQPTNATPTPVQQDAITEAIAALNTAVGKCEDCVEHYPKIVENNWYVWDAETEDFVDTGIDARGLKGDQGVTFYPDVSVNAVISWTNDGGLPNPAPVDLTQAIHLDEYATKSELNSKIDVAEKGVENGIAELDSTGKIPSSQLPSYVDDVLEFSSVSAFPARGEAGKIYISISNNTTYRWSGTQYVAIGSSLALGETSSTAYRGDRGKYAYDHALNKGGAFSLGLYKIQTNSEGHVVAVQTPTAADFPSVNDKADKTDTVLNTTLSRGRTGTAGAGSVAFGDNVQASGSYSHAEGYGTSSVGVASHSEGKGTRAYGDYSHAEGARDNTKTTRTINGATYQYGSGGNNSHTEGRNTLTYGTQSHAEGYETAAIGGAAHAEGENTVALGVNSHAEGYWTTASGDDAHAEGTGTTASELGAHAEGAGTTASGAQAHAEGGGTTASGPYSHTEGSESQASGGSAHAEGGHTTASGGGSHAEGGGTLASGAQAHAEGGGTTASGTNSHAEGAGSQASGAQAHAEGGGTTASESGSHAEGLGTTASGSGSHAEGGSTIASGMYSHAEGYGTSFILCGTTYTPVAAGITDHTEGYQTLTAQGGQPGNHAEGYQTRATGGAAHSEGAETYARGNNSHAEGRATEAGGYAAHAEGFATNAAGSFSHVSGMNNVADSYVSWPEWVANTSYSVGDKVKRTSTSSETTTVYAYICKTANSDSTFTSSKWTDQNGKMNFAEIVGNGIDSNATSNARALDWDGNAYYKGNVYVGCNADSTGGTRLITSSEVATTTETQAIINEYGVSA